MPSKRYPRRGKDASQSNRQERVDIAEAFAAVLLLEEAEEEDDPGGTSEDEEDEESGDAERKDDGPVEKADGMSLDAVRSAPRKVSKRRRTTEEPGPSPGDGSLGHSGGCSGRVSVSTPSRRLAGWGDVGVRGSCVDSESQTMRYVPRYGSRELVYNKFCGRRCVSRFVCGALHACERTHHHPENGLVDNITRATALFGVGGF